MSRSAQCSNVCQPHPLMGVGINLQIFFLRIWTFHSIPSNECFCKLIPIPMLSGGVGKRDFSVQTLTFHISPSKKMRH